MMGSDGMMRAEATIFPRRTRHRLALPAVGLAALAFVLVGCNTVTGPGSPTAAVFSADLESKPPARASTADELDTEEHKRIVAAYGGIYRNSKVEQTLVPIVSRIVAASDRPDQPYRITILNSPAINAFALPGGYLYVTRGLLALASDSSEVAAVLAHEMAHVTANHAAARQNKARDAQIVSRAVADVDPASREVALASSRRTLATFSQQQELEADAMGVRTIGKAGYDPFAAARFLTTMAEYSGYRAALSMRDKRRDFLSSHPSTPQRVSFAERAARQFGAPGVGTTDRERYLAGIDGMTFGDDPSQGFVRDKSFFHPTLKIGFSVPDGFVIDNTSDAVLATGVDGTALRFDAVGLAAGTDMVEYLRSGWVNGLDESSVRSFTVNGLNAAVADAEAKGWFFQIAVIQAGGAQTYRFIFANEERTDAFRRAAEATVNSFRRLTDRDIAALNVLRVKVIEATAGDTEATLARRMRGVDRPRELFRALNNLQPGARIEAGTKVKIIDDR